MANRPIAPHLQIWRWGPHMAVSILHRVTGDGMALLGLPILVWWLAALASGGESYATFQAAADSIIGQIILIGLSWAYFSHLASGIRHFVLDIGSGYELGTNKTWSWLTPAIGLLLTVVFWALVLTR
ncbi:succinate dehydrogenase, cytochrome b556 subunit [Altererythrobacter sp. TH136]|uniref:succinate dehydrogenase, cytochrome b556 subunit n=1 Tax=Altererythrobacter sp. TH136 TaxID=2067415 RepID=UPI0011631DF6|nr:succinate dehydrogenase, cytochrome b556 subunit [Altererythrobacter sp. TH136]QDM40148.1 succinate dehydrogenase, cytochrome b556 subunit [Altererythrobacter sp. TH136]